MKKTSKKVEEKVLNEEEMMKENQEEVLDLEEFAFLIENAEKYYNDLKDLNQILSDEAFYILVTMSMLRDYRKTSEIEITNMLLVSYETAVTAIINHDEKFVIGLIKFLEEEGKANGHIN